MWHLRDVEVVGAAFLGWKRFAKNLQLLRELEPRARATSPMASSDAMTGRNAHQISAGKTIVALALRGECQNFQKTGLLGLELPTSCDCFVSPSQGCERATSLVALSDAMTALNPWQLLTGGSCVTWKA